MLDQLVESKSTSKENIRRSEFMFTTMIVMVSLLLGGWLYSLFAKDYGMGGSDLELSTLVAPVPVPEDEPPPPQLLDEPPELPPLFAIIEPMIHGNAPPPPNPPPPPRLRSFLFPPPRPKIIIKTNIKITRPQTTPAPETEPDFFSVVGAVCPPVGISVPLRRASIVLI